MSAENKPRKYILIKKMLRTLKTRRVRKQEIKLIKKYYPLIEKQTLIMKDHKAIWSMWLIVRKRR